MTKTNNYTSTGTKLFNHVDRVLDMKVDMVSPIVAHIMPTSVCNLNCPYCSIKSRPREELDIEVIETALKELKKCGLLAVIISGGGEPTLYKDFDKLINIIKEMGLEIGLITNGTLLKNHDMSKFEWVRISINPETIDNLDLPEIPGTLGFSYIVSNETKQTLTENFAKIQKLVDKYNPEYVRILSDCALSNEEIIENQKLIDASIKKRINKKFFQQHKLPEPPKSCYLGYLHPVLYCDGYVYPCDSIVLNDHEDQRFKEKYRICDIKDLDPLLEPRRVKSLVCPKKDCPNCVFAKQNNIIDSLLNPTEVHKNFI